MNLILSDTKRSYNYLNELLKNKIKIYEIIIYSKKELFYLKDIILKINSHTKLNIIKSNSINSKLINNLLLSSKNEKFLFSGYSGEIIRNMKILKNKKLLHCHSGKIPNFRGSTTIYYSLILTKKIYCTLFRLTNKIDTGKIYFIKKFNPPKITKTIENNFDNFIRAKTISSFCNNNKKKLKESKKLNANNNNYYYIAHPIIRSLILNKKKIIKNLR